ncbi:MAG: cell division topological specificity factor MinE [Anaerolineae bacterium]
MAGFWSRLFGKTREVELRGSSDVARERLQFILIHDRIHLPPERMDMMKQEILAVLRKYIDVEGDNLDIALQKRDKNSLLVAEVPFNKAVQQDDPDDYDPAGDDA